MPNMQTENEQPNRPQVYPEDNRAQHLFGKLIREINRKLTAGSDYESVLSFIFDSLSMLIPYDRIGIALLDERRELVQLKWVRSNVPIRVLPRNYSAPLKGSSLSKILSTGRPRIISDLVTYAADHPQSESTKLVIREGIRSSLTCPLRAGNKPIGFVFFSSCQPGTYDDSHIETFLEIADELSVIIEQGRLKDYFSDKTSREQTMRMIVHDLQSPLGIIQGFLETITDEDWYRNLNHDGKEVFAILQRNTGYMLKLVTEITELTQLDGKVTDQEREEVNLREFCANLSTYGTLLGDKKEIRFRTLIDPSLRQTARLAPQKIQRALDNLFTNAIKFSKRGSEVTFSVTQDQDRLIFSVADQGPGIPENEIPKLFQEFGKASVQPTEGEGTTGLGLAIARKIVERHGGQISVKSKVGEGSQFSFWLPLDPTTTVH